MQHDSLLLLHQLITSQSVKLAASLYMLHDLVEALKIVSSAAECYMNSSCSRSSAEAMIDYCHLQERTRVYNAVVSAVGNYHEPNLPDVVGIDTYPGEQLHCHNYRSNDRFAGKTVLVVGASFSGGQG